MGLLDDAIRDHLDLKRRRGADPAEVERAEQEALGPVRRGPAQPPVPLEEERPDPVDADDSGWDEHPPGPEDDEDFEPYDDAFEDDEFDEEPAPPPVQMAPPPASSGPEPLRFSDEAADVAPSPHDPHEPSTAEFFEAAPSAQEHLRAHSPAPDEEPSRPSPAEPDITAEFDVSQTLDEQGEPVERRDEDMLEETPEFLSETPDHDRLWFEQKPPRDFDFDG